MKFRPLNRRGHAPLMRALTIAIGVVLLIAGGFPATSPALASPAQENLAPTLPGAPFLPIADRTEHVIARYETLVALDEIEQAQLTLSLRTANSITGADAEPGSISETRRILNGQQAILERTLAQLTETEQPLLDETAPFGIGLAIFPVDEVRKPFWNDWGRPRSGGRSHVGTDVLAQVGIPLRAIEDGSVESISTGGLGGNGVFLLGDSGSRYYYAHMHEIADLEPGDRIFAGQPVGSVGDSGNASGAPHLHMQWDPTGEANWQNPYPMLDVLFGPGRTEAFADEAEAILAAVAQGDGEDPTNTDVGADIDSIADTDAPGADLVTSIDVDRSLSNPIQ